MPAPVQIGVLWLAVMLVLGLAIVMTAADMLRCARRLAFGHPAPNQFEGGADLVTPVLERSSSFAPDLVVTVDYAEPFRPGQILERRIGIEYVYNIQENGFVQIRVVKVVSNPDELWQRIRNCDLPTLARVVVRPSMTMDEVVIGGPIA
jgi:hypothetical protein